MEITSKEMKKATYKVEATSDEYNVAADVTVSNGGVVTNIESGKITKDGKYIAGFGVYGTDISINYSGEATLEEQSMVLAIIDNMKKLSL